MVEQNITELVTAALRAFQLGNGPAFETAVDDLVQAPDLDGWRALTERSLTSSLTEAIGGAWRRGWQPADVARGVGRRVGRPHRRLGTDPVAAGPGRDPPGPPGPRRAGTPGR